MRVRIQLSYLYEIYHNDYISDNEGLTDAQCF
jgi:hypothetical protein